MLFEADKAIQKYLQSIEDITALREQKELQLAAELENLAAIKKKTDYEARADYQHAQKSVEDLNVEISGITSQGKRYILKIDQLNGVR